MGETVRLSLLGAVLFLSLWGSVPILAQTVPIISEFMAVNEKTLADEDKDFSDWIEIHNPTVQTVSLDGWHLTDDAEDLAKWTFPPRAVLSPNGFLVVFASGKDRLDPGRSMHTNFKLSGGGEYLALVAGDGVTVIHAYSPMYPEQLSDVSYGLYPAGGTGAPQYFTQPTPGRANVAGAQGRVVEVEFSHERGFYTNSFELTLTTPTSGARIYYTLDGSEPSSVHGDLYTEPIPIDWTSVVRAKALRPGYLASRTVTHTYLYTSDVVWQSPYGEPPGPGWPTGPVNDQQFEYGMDPDITVHPTWGPLMEQALVSIPTLSIVTDLANLFDPQKGIYVNAGGHGEDWECPMSLELIYPANPQGSGFPDLVQSPNGQGGTAWRLPGDMAPGFQINAGLRIRGGFSRSSGNPKHAFRAFFRGEYGDGELRYRLFGDEGQDRFECVDIRTSQNYSWAYQRDPANTLCREVWARDSQGRMGGPYTRSRYYHLYINGQYWGIYMTQERPEASFGESYLGGVKVDYDCIKATGPNAGYTIEATDGTMDNWKRLWELSILGFNSNVNYYRALGMNPDGTRNPQYPVLLNEDDLIDYMLMVFYDGDRDAPISNFLGNVRPNNWFGLYHRGGNEGFVFFVHDAEHILSCGMTDRTGPYPCGDQLLSSNPQWIHQELMAHPDYRIRFADHAYRHLFNDGLLTPNQAIDRFKARAAQIDMAIIAESARWGSASLNKNTWQAAVDYEVQNFFPSRTQTLISQLKQTRLKNGSLAPLYPSIDPPRLSPAGGTMAKGQTISMTAAKGSIYYSLDGSDPRLPVAQSSPGGTVTLIPENAAKRVFIPLAPVKSSPGSILAEYWFNIGGTSLTDLTGSPDYPYQPGATEFLSSFEIPVDRYDNYGTRVRGWLHPPQSGAYTFWISSDDASQLWLSTDENPANKVSICQVSGWTASREWAWYPEQQSKAVTLTGGKRYYIEALQKEGGGGDNLAVAWQGPSISHQIIPGQYLSPDGIGWITPEFVDTTWRQGTGGVGYEQNPSDAVNFTGLIGLDIRTDIWRKGSGCYIRIPFTITARDLADLTLKVRYDDGFIAYLNGAQVLRVNLDAQSLPAWDSVAQTSRPDGQAVVAQAFDLTAYLGLLQAGQNVLAIHALNRSTTDDDMLLSVEMTGNSVSQGDISPAAIRYSGSIPLTQGIQVKARAFDGIWSALAEAAYTIGP